MMTRRGNTMSALRAGAAAAIALSALAGGAAAADWRLSFGLPESYSIYPEMQAFAQRLTEAGMPTKVFPSGQLLTHAEASPGLRDGLADIAFVVTPYFPAEYSETLTIQNLSMLATSGDRIELPGVAMNGAAMEYTLLNCPKCLEQFAAQNQVYLVGSSSGPYILGCTKPVKSAEDLKGLRVRVGAGNFSRWADYVGAVGIQMPGNEAYDALGKGALDCNSIGLADLYGQRMLEVTNSITLGAPGGVFAGLGIVNFNADVWKGLTAEQREQVVKIAVRASAETAIKYPAYDKVAYDVAQQGGKHEIIELPDDIAALNAAFVDADMAVIEAELRDKYGIENAGEKIAVARGLIEKWKGLTKDIGLDDVDALEKLYWDEIFAKLDLATYGMN